MKNVDAAGKDPEELRSRLAAIVESSDDAILSKTLDGVIVTWNQGATRMFGYTPEEAIGRPVTMLIPADRQHEEPAILERLRRGERIDHYESHRRRIEDRARHHRAEARRGSGAREQ
jgi:PAS domain S-box-containing protein